MYLDYILLILFIGFLMRIVFKRQGGHGLIIPTLIATISGTNLLVGSLETVWTVVGFCLVIAYLGRVIYPMTKS